METKVAKTQEERPSIPKIIHYCWFGKAPLPEQAIKCIQSWQKHCPDYEIIQWSEENFDINSNQYVKGAYEAKKWAFVSDYVRLYALVEHGGVYMDTDCEIIKPIDCFLKLEAFSGFQQKNEVPTAIMGCSKNQPFFKELLNSYNDRTFLLDNGEYDFTTNVSTITNACAQYGLKFNNKKQTISGFTLYPTEYFCPLNWQTGKLKKTNNTYAIHWFAGSWVDEHRKVNMLSKIKYLTKKLLPFKMIQKLRK